MNQLKRLVQDQTLSATQTVELLRNFIVATELLGRLGADQLSHIGGAILGCAHPNVLIFGLGSESPFWHACNPSGRTAFVENRSSRITQMRLKLTRAEIWPVSYSTRRGKWQPELVWPLGWPAELSRIRWDVILIDADADIEAGQSGRQHSIWTASQLMRSCTRAFIYKYEREWERRCADAYLGSPKYVIQGAEGALAEW